MDKTQVRQVREKKLEEKCEDLLDGLQNAIHTLSSMKAKYKAAKSNNKSLI
jgi:hypothetical protein